MSDYIDVATRLVVDSDILRVYPGAIVQLFESGTTNLVTEVTADSNGVWTVPTLEQGKYDIRVDGQLSRTIEYVKSDHTHEDKIWEVFFDGNQTVNRNEDQNHPIYSSGVVGSIVEVIVTAERVANNAEIEVHIMRGDESGSGALTCSGNSVWSQVLTNTSGSTKYRMRWSDSSPGITLSASQAIACGLVYTASGVEGVNMLMVFRPD